MRRAVIKYAERTARSDMIDEFVNMRGELVNFLTRRLLCRATAEDIVQDVYLRLQSTSSVAHHPRQLIYRTATNMANNHCRDERRRAELRDEALDDDTLEVDRLTPERTAIARDGLMRLAREIAAWPARTSEIFILNRFEGFTQREICAQLRLSSTAVEKHMSRAIRNLAQWTARANS